MPRHEESFEHAVLRWVQARETFGRSWVRYTTRPSHARFTKLLRAQRLMQVKAHILRHSFGLTNAQMQNAENRLYARARAPRTP